MKELEDDTIKIEQEKDKPYKREKPIFKKGTDYKHSQRNKLFIKDINQEDKYSSPKKQIELSTKGSGSPIESRNKSKTLYKFAKHEKKDSEYLILENKRKLSRLTKKTYYDKSRINLTQQQKQYKINIIKRNYNNNIYLNNIDQSISFVIPYKYTCSVYMFLLLGIPYIITLFSNRKLIEWRGEPCKVKDANFYLIVDGYGNYHICNFTKKHFNTNFCAENRLKGYDNKYISTLFSSIELSDKEEYHEIFYVYNKYYCYRKAEILNKNIDNFKNIKRDLNTIFEEENSVQDIKTHSPSVDISAKDKLKNNISNYNYNNKTIYYNKDYYFESPVFNLACTTNKNIYNIFNNYFLEQKEIQFQLNIYGQNKLILKVINYLTILVEKLINFVNIYIILVIIFWWYENYFFFYFILILTIILTIITTYQKYLNKKKVVDFSLNKQEKITVYEGPQKTNKLVEYENLVPGQIIKVKEEDVLPCDCLLLDGFCSCIESSLTGESSSIMKYKLPKNSAIFNYSENQKSYLFCGTKIENCFPSELKALVIGTGFNTQRGNLIQSVLFPRKSNYNFYKENITFFIFTFVSFVIGTIIFIILFNRQNNGETKRHLFQNILDLLVMVVPPTLPLSLTLGTFYYQYSLMNKKISCSGVYRLMAAGKINKLIFDKTGTLTEEDLELYGYVSSIKKDSSLILDSREQNSKLYLSYLSQYYKNEFHTQIVNSTSKTKEKKSEKNSDKTSNKNFNKRKKKDSTNDKEIEIEKHENNKENNEIDLDDENEKDDTDNTITYFMECLATCHSVTKVNDENKGNSIDTKIFNEVNWIYDSLNINAKANDQFEVKPKKFFKITEEQYFMKNKNINFDDKDNIFLKNTIDHELNSYKLKVIYRSHFESRNQSMSVIVKNNFNNSIRLYIKGAPEKIIMQCLEKSIPINYDEVHRKYTLQGFRVLACATKLISNNSEKEEEIICNEIYQNYKGNDLIFLGLILFQNKIKTHTKKVLQKLKNDGLFPIISTGDNAFTSISLVKECNLVKNNSKFCIMDMDISQLNIDEKKSVYFGERSSKIATPKKNVFLNCTFEQVNYEQPSKNSNETFTVVLNDKIEPNDYEMYQRRNINGKSNDLLHVGEFNNRILKENDMKLCIHSHVFDFIFFRNKEGVSLNEDLMENISENKNARSVKDEELNILRQIIVDRGILFFRMNPNDKTKLVQLFKKQNSNNIVAMCGDGANDCSALISADVGVSLKSRENIIMTSHLMAKTKSIAIINDIINIGKACYENSTIILKILLIYSEIKICSRCLLKIFNDNLTRNQYFYLDCIIILFGSCLMSLSDPNYKIKEKTFSKLLVNKIYLVSIIGHTIAQLGLLIIYFFCIINSNEIYCKNEKYCKINKNPNKEIYSEEITTVNSYIFFFNSVQCLSLVFMLNYFSICKQSLFKGRLFTLYLILICLILTEILSLENFGVGIFKIGLVKFVELDNEGTESQNSRLILFLFCLASFSITMIWEYFVNWFFSINYAKYLQKEDEKVSKRLKNSYRQKTIAAEE